MADEFARRTVALVGHCAPDAFALRSAVRSVLPGAEVVSIMDDSALSATTADLFLVNRLLDGSFDNPSGLQLTAALSDAGSRVMLISNFPDAQAAASRAGAVAGFGKAELYSQNMRTRLLEAMTESETSAG